MTIQEEDLSLQVADHESVEEEKARHIRELRLKEMFADAPKELQGIIDEAKAEPIEDLEALKPHDTQSV